MKAPVQLIALCVFLGGCVSEDVDQSPESDLHFFSIQEYIEEHRQAVDSLVAVSKSITVDGMTETKEFKSYSVLRDIEDFDLLDIDKPALWDKYRVDTILEQGINTITYTATDKKMSVRKFATESSGNDMLNIHIEKISDTFLAKVKTTYDWQPFLGYRILREEDRLFANPTVHEIKVNILPDH